LKYSIIEPFENALLHLENLALRATPGIRKVLEGNTGGDPPLGISFGRIVDIMAFEANPPAKFRFLWHNPIHCILFFVFRIKR
jgi:hypothetical protein